MTLEGGNHRLGTNIGRPVFLSTIRGILPNDNTPSPSHNLLNYLENYFHFS